MLWQDSHLGVASVTVNGRTRGAKALACVESKEKGWKEMETVWDGRAQHSPEEAREGSHHMSSFSSPNAPFLVKRQTEPELESAAHAIIQSASERRAATTHPAQVRRMTATATALV